MMNLVKKMNRNFALVTFLFISISLLAGCASSKAAEAQNATPPKLITDIVTSEDAEAMIVTIKGNHPLTYTAVKQDFPAGVLLLFPETALDQIEEVYYPSANDLIHAIKATQSEEDGNASRIFIALNQDVPYELNAVDAHLDITFPKKDVLRAQAEPSVMEEEKAPVTTPSEPVDEGASAATRLESVIATPLDKNVSINVQADGPVKDYKFFTINDPARIVFDLYQLKSPHKTEQKVPVDSKWVQRVRHYGYPDRVRLVLDTQNAHLSKFAAAPVASGLVIRVGEDAGLSQVAAQRPVLAQASQPAPLQDMKAPATKPLTSEVPPESAVKTVSGEPAWVNRIDFSSEEAGKSVIMIGTTRPVQYQMKKVGAKRLHLTLFNTNLPENRKRPLITTRFASAVDRVMPMPSPETQKDALVTIELREAVPYFIEQNEDLIRVNLAASSMPPKAYEQSNLPAWKKALAQKTPDPESASRQAEVPALAGNATEDAVMADPKEETFEERLAQSLRTKVYSGEKVALDFYETDIKNVFRILKEISGKNFAIDKNVTGKVTLSLDKPVPWDQVLDLVLKMNQLGMTMEGDIIRIATLNTLAQEEKLRQAQIKAEQEARKAERALEPLLTEYIAINYSNAKTEVVPHLNNILTADRGKISVDQRNNQIIITDTADKIRQAKEIVQKIDKVTPQVIIEARIVEANSDFTRDLGFDWGDISIGPFDIGNVSTVLSLAASNLPQTRPTGSIGFNFTKLTGTPFSIIDARLEASETEGQTNIISAPKIVTLDNKKAKIKQGFEVPYLERDSSGNATVRFKDVDLLLEVTPNVTPDSRITLNIFITKNDIAGEFIEGQPSLSTNEARTELLVEDGDTVVIGGIIKSNIDLSESGIPGLRKVPGLGWLFKSNSKTDRKQELLIFITPRIVQLEQRQV
ncbi:MAG: type IV pilus secretin PilQ [Desulfobacterales bacterium]|nr:MAG: type IV pilus secretin PilQ [Desulfobacterales bacterium]